ncbi:MAG: DUF3108 domain-containing protein [Reyranellaceae bacterium]
MDAKAVVRPVGCALAAVMLAAAGLPACAVAAEDRRVALSYEVHVGGLHALKADASVDILGDRFMAEAKVAKTGIVAALSKLYRAVHVSRGRIVDGRVLPDGSVMQINSGDEARGVRASYMPDGTLVVAENPPFTPKPGREVERADRAGAWDPLMAAIVAVLGRNDPCNAPLPIYDGRTRFDLDMRRLGSEKLETDGFTLRGDAVVCEVRLRKVAGYKPDTDPEEDYDKPAKLWLGRIDDTGRLYPVRVEVDTSYGAAVGHLRKADSRPLSEGERAALAK